MPKEKRDCSSVSFNRSKSSSFPCGSSQSLLSSTKNPLENEENVKEWEGARCPVCMEHPHNAILLMCSSHDKGCHPFMCDTSYRHSNCFDQFRKSFKETSPTIAQQEDTPVSTSTAHSTAYSVISESTATNFQVERNDEGSSPLHSSCDNLLKGKMVCPLCRGHINGWMVMEPARVFMNAKSRSCACETCDFSGTYTDLRKHARLVHPLVRPSEADPDRQRDWRMIEQQRDFGDLISTLQSSIGEERSEDTMLSFDEGGWLTVFFLIRVFRRRSSSRGGSLSRTSSARVVTGRRRLSTNGLWGESYDDGNSRDRDNESSDDGSGHLRPHERRIRRRTTPDEQS